MSETWVLNATLTTTIVTFMDNNFTSDDVSYIGIRGTSKGLNYVLPNDQSSLVYMGGWISENDRTITFETAPSGDLLTWLQANGTKQAASTKKSVDLTTLSGWANLADGEHTITIKAKADGYRDSQASEGVSVTKGSTGETWVLNETVVGDNKLIFTVDFVSNSQNFTAIIPTPTDMNYRENSGDILAYDKFSGWTNQAYRTITFATAPTGDLLTWLQANGTKQGGGVTLIDFSISGTTYKSENGMTWEQWCSSSYNTNGNFSTLGGNSVYYLAGSGAMNVALPNGTNVNSADTIIAETAYILLGGEN